VFAKSVKPAKPSLPNPNDHYRFQMIMLTETWFKLTNQLTASSGIISLDLANEFFADVIRNLFETFEGKKFKRFYYGDCFA